MSIESISSTKSGLPSAASAIRSRPRRRAPPDRRGSRSAGAHSSSERGSSSTDVAFSLPPPQPGRTSSSSGRARQTRRIGASRVESAMCSTRSRKVASPQWMSSKTRTRGWAARGPRRARAPRCEPSSAPPPCSARPISLSHLLGDELAARPRPRARVRASSEHASGESPSVEPDGFLHGLQHGPEGDPLAVWRGSVRAPPAPGPPRSPRNSWTSRDLPTPAGPSTVKSWHDQSPTAWSKASCSRRRSRSRPIIGEIKTPARGLGRRRLQLDETPGVIRRLRDDRDRAPTGGSPRRPGCRRARPPGRGGTSTSGALRLPMRGRPLPEPVMTSPVEIPTRTSSRTAHPFGSSLASARRASRASCAGANRRAERHPRARPAARRRR